MAPIPPAIGQLIADAQWRLAQLQVALIEDRMKDAHLLADEVGDDADGLKHHIDVQVRLPNALKP